MSDLSISLELTNGAGRSSLNLMSRSTPLKTSTLSSNGSCHQTGSTLGLQDIPSPPVPSKSNNVANKASNLSHVPCKFFKQGTCTAGTNCTFSHNLAPNSESSVCKYFIKGNCKFGTKCALLHTMSPYGDNRKFMNSWNSSNGGGSLLQQKQQQQQQYQQIQNLSDTPQSSPYPDFGRQNSNGFSQLTAAIQQQQNHHQHRQQHHNMQGLSTSIPTNSSLYQYRTQGNSIKHPGISSLRTTPSVWDHAATNNNSGSNSNSFIDSNGYLQRIPEIDRFEGLASTSSRQQFNHVDGIQLDGVYQSSPGLSTLSKSYDPWTRNSSRFFQNPINGGSPQATATPNIHSFSFQAPNTSSLNGSFAGASSDAFLGTSINAGSGNSTTDLSDIWSSPYPVTSSSSSGFNDGANNRSQHLFDTTSSASAINIPGINLSTPISNQQRQSMVSVEDVDFALHYRRRQLYHQQYYRQEQQHPQSFSSHANTPEPSFISPSAMSFTEDMYRQRPIQSTQSTAITTPTPGTRSMISHDENDAPFFMEDTEDDGPSTDHSQQPDAPTQSVGFPSFTSLVRPTY